MERDTPSWLSGRTVLRGAFVLGVLAIVVPFIITGAPSVVGAEESYVVLSGSMADEPEPVINPGDIIIVQEADPQTIEAGDIITYQTGESTPITHRVIEVQQQDDTAQFRTKGDANEDPDSQLIGPDQVVGELMLTIPLVGHVVNFANTTAGFVVLVLLPIGLLVVSEAWNMATEDADDESSAGHGSEGGDDGGGDPLAPGGRAHSQQAVSGGATAGTQRLDHSQSHDQPAGTAETGPVRTDGAAAPNPPGTVTGQGTHDSAKAAQSTPANSGSGDSAETEGETMVSLERKHLLVAGAVLAPAVLGTGYAAVTLQTTWAIILCYASAGLFLLTAFVYVRMGRADADSETDPDSAVDESMSATATPGGGADIDAQTGATAATTAGRQQPMPAQSRVRALSDWIVTGSLGVAPQSAPQLDVRVEAVVPLVEMAADRGTRVVHDPDEAAYYLVGEQALFRCAEADADVVTGGETEPTSEPVPEADTEPGSGGPESEWRPEPEPESEPESTSEEVTNDMSNTGADAEPTPHDGSDEQVAVDSLTERPGTEDTDTSDIPEPTRNGDPGDVGSETPAENNSGTTREENSSVDSEGDDHDRGEEL